MLPPVFIQEAETVWNDGTTPKTTASFNVQAADVLVAFSVVEGFAVGDIDNPTTISGGSLIWTARQTVQVTDYCQAILWTAVPESDKSMTVSFALVSVAGAWFGGNVLTFRSSDGIGTSAQNNADSAAPTVNLTTTRPMSAIVAVNGDWYDRDVTGRVWRTNAGPLSEVSAGNTGRYAYYGGYHANAGPIGTYAVGLTADATQRYGVAAIEIFGSGTTPNVRRKSAMQHMLVR